MALPDPKILVLVEPPTAYVRLVGRAAVEVTPGFKAFIRRLDHEGIQQFCLDLTECKLMDSTFSGALAALATDLGPPNPHGCARFTLVNPNERVRDLLDNLGVLPLVNVLTGDGHTCRDEETEELAMAGATREEVALCCLDAHRFLMNLNSQNRPKFAELTRVLEQQVPAGR